MALKAEQHHLSWIMWITVAVRFLSFSRFLFVLRPSYLILFFFFGGGELRLLRGKGRAYQRASQLPESGM